MPYATVAASSRSSTLRLRAFSGHRPCNTSGLDWRGSGSPCSTSGPSWRGSGTSIQRGADVGGVVVAVAAAGEGRWDVVDVFL